MQITHICSKVCWQHVLETKSHFKERCHFTERIEVKAKRISNNVNVQTAITSRRFWDNCCVYVRQGVQIIILVRIYFSYRFLCYYIYKNFFKWNYNFCITK